jgi:hypothetical protein
MSAVLKLRCDHPNICETCFSWVAGADARLRTAGKTALTLNLLRHRRPDYLWN